MINFNNKRKMKIRERIIILGIMTVLISCLSSCIKRSCECEAVGYASNTQLQTVLDRYGKEGCMDVVENGGYWIDYTGIELYCYEE
jgi:putative lipase involved disintegration of autophagic bodies